MRSHPVVGTFFLLVAGGLFALGAFASDAPALLERIPVPPEVVIPFVLWQVGVWCTMFGVFFLRPRRRGAGVGRWGARRHALRL